jgi:hypothetical protein
MIDVDWGDANETLLIWTFSNDWTAQEFLNAFTLCEEFVASRSNRSVVHILLDTQHTTHLPKDMFKLGRHAIKRCIDIRQKGLIIIIDSSTVWVQMYDFLMRRGSNSLHIHFAKDTDKAYQIMVEADALLSSN